MPVLRLLLPFLLGVLQQRFCPVQVRTLLPLLIAFSCITAVYNIPLLPFSRRYKSGFVNGLSVFCLFAVVGSLSVWRQDVRNRPLWPGNIYKESDALVIKLVEKPVERTNSFKAEASLQTILRAGRQLPVKGHTLVYFARDASSFRLSAGDVIVVSAPLQPIPSTASPGNFDFRKYAFLQGITHQLFTGSNYRVIGHDPDLIAQVVSVIQAHVISLLSTAFPDKKQRGLAEALLIGYKNDLDKGLVQSYTNTGVVHIIAISGLHLGLIYWLLVKLLFPLTLSVRTRWMAPVLTIAALWLFTLLAGAQPSVLRSAIMFTCIVIGNSLSRRSDHYNSLALSALILLSINPYWLWDAGFQLSYTALIGIMVFMKPIYALMHFRNRIVDMIWQMNAVTLAAQLLTLPVCIYHFRQFPNYFLLTNLIAVPLSSLILLLEMLLCAISLVPAIFSFVATITGWLITLMNTCIERVEQLPFSVWNGLQISVCQAILLAAFLIAGLCCLLYPEKIRPLYYTCAVSLCGFMILRCFSFIEAGRQQQIIVYRGCVDFIAGRNHVSFSLPGNKDPGIAATRSFFRLRDRRHTQTFQSDNAVSFSSKRIVLITGSIGYLPSPEKTSIQLLILSNDPVYGPAELSQSMNISQVVTDATIPAWKSRKWQQYCDSAGIAFHDIRTKGAFVMKL